MKTVCRSCHASGWVDGHFVMLDKAIETTNEMTLTATKLMSQIWEEGYAEGLPQGKSIFDEAIEKKWVEEWLFYANTVRFSAAMAGADYGVFAYLSAVANHRTGANGNARAYLGVAGDCCR